MPPPHLPPHLTHKCALALLPPAQSPIINPIERLRSQHDKHFARWPPHINLIYPFLDLKPNSSNHSDDHQHDPITAVSDDNAASTVETVRSRVRKAVADVPPFTLFLYDTGHFLHGKQSATVWFRPGERGGTVDESSATIDGADDRGAEGDVTTETEREPTTLLELQRGLQSEFPECNADTRPFVPHLSIGQAKGSTGAVELKKKVHEVMGAEFNLKWKVDRLVILERKGFRDRFKVVHEIGLGRDVGDDEAETADRDEALQ